MHQQLFGDGASVALRADSDEVGVVGSGREQAEATLTGECDFAALLRSLSPRLNDGRYVDTQVRTDVPAGADPVMVVREDEGVTLVLAQVQADELDSSARF